MPKTDDTRAAAGGAALALAMRRRGMSAPQVAERSRGEVSASSVRSWIAGAALPTPRKALAAANALGDLDAAREVLTAWGYHDAADGLEETPAVATSREPQYRGEFAQTAIGDTFTARITAILETSLGLEWVALTDRGYLLRIVPIFSAAVDPARLAEVYAPPSEVTEDSDT
jgi:hypothetical protein